METWVCLRAERNENSGRNRSELSRSEKFFLPISLSLHHQHQFFPSLMKPDFTKDLLERCTSPDTMAGLCAQTTKHSQVRHIRKSCSSGPTAGVTRLPCPTWPHGKPVSPQEKRFSACVINESAHDDPDSSLPRPSTNKAATCSTLLTRHSINGHARHASDENATDGRNKAHRHLKTDRGRVPCSRCMGDACRNTMKKMANQ